MRTWSALRQPALGFADAGWVLFGLLVAFVTGFVGFTMALFVTCA